MITHGNTLAHYGILGMRWGVRRRVTQSHPDRSIVTSSKKKGVKDLSDDELKRSINRLQLEQRYRELNPTAVSRGKKIVGGILVTAGSALAASYTKDALSFGVKKALEVASKAAG